MKIARLCRLLSLWPLALAPGARATDVGWTSGGDVTLEAASGLSGGVRRGDALHGLVHAHVAWEQPAGGTSGPRWLAFASLLSLEGRGPTERFLGDFLAASNMEGYNSTRLYTWWLETRAGDWSFRAGALLADEELTGTEAGGIFCNSVFGWPAFISANTVNTGPAYFVTAPGLRLERRLGGSATWRIGVYDGDTFDSPAGDPTVNPHGWHYQLGGAQGWFAITEAAWGSPTSANRFKAGSWLHTATFADVRDDAVGRPFALSGAAPREHAMNYGAYVVGERIFAGKPGEAGYTSGFVRVGIAPEDRNALGWVLDSGIARTGLLPGRPADVAAIGFAHASFGSRFAAGGRLLDPTQPPFDFEQVFEASYVAPLSEHFSFMPDLQYIRHPGGSAALRDAVVFFVRLKASY